MEKEECSICFFQYDKIHKVPRILRCGHTFCQVCLDEIKGGSVKKASNTITCPNCRVATENVTCTKNLPENDGVFQSAPHSGAGMGRNGAAGSGNPAMSTNLLNSPYEAAKRLQRESTSLLATGQRFIDYLQSMEQIVSEGEQIVLTSYQREYQKLDQIAQILVHMIGQYKEKLQLRLTEGLVKERHILNEHAKAIADLKNQTFSIRENLQDVVDSELKTIHDNEQEYHRLQSEQYRLQQQIEEQEAQQRQLMQSEQQYASLEDKINKPQLLMPSSPTIGAIKPTLHSSNPMIGMKLNNAPLVSVGGGVGMMTSMQINIALNEPVNQQLIMIEEANSSSESNLNNSDDACSQKSSNSSSQPIKVLRGEEVSAMKRANEEQAEEISCSVQLREKEDRARLNNVRTIFYQLNERFEQLLKFKPIKKVETWTTELNMDAAYGMMDAFKLEEVTQSFEEQIKTLEVQLDLKDYFDIKRPTVVFFTQNPTMQKQSKVTVSRFDLLCEKGSGSGFHEGSISQAKILAQSQQSLLRLEDCRAITHPSNNSVFLVQGGTTSEKPLQLFLFDNQNDVLLQKPSIPHQLLLSHISGQAITYSEGFIYFLGGFDHRTSKIIKGCARYNIVTEKWQLLNPMLFEIMEGAACEINEYQIVVAGGVNSVGQNSDILQLYDVRENQWRLFETCLSTPRRLMTMVSSQKDRVMIIGGTESDSSASRIVEEFDFIKRNLVSLPMLKQGRVNPSAFLVNDAIYVFGGCGNSANGGTDVVIGEKLALRENKWREVISRSENSHPAKRAMEKLNKEMQFGPAALLYE